MGRKIERMIAPSLDAMGYDVVRVRLGGGNEPTLQVMAELKTGAAMTAEDCADISHAVSALLDVEDPIDGPFVLEVSSPGIDRPLVRAADFDRFAGFEARIELHGMIDGRRRFQGRLQGMVGDGVRLEAGSGSIDIPIDAIRNAKLVLTDALLAAGLAAGAKRNEQQAE